MLYPTFRAIPLVTFELLRVLSLEQSMGPLKLSLQPAQDGGSFPAALRAVRLNGNDQYLGISGLWTELDVDSCDSSRLGAI